MKKSTITNFASGLLMVLMSCQDNKDNVVKKETTVDIFESTIPANGAVDQEIQLQLKAHATSGCYSNLKIHLIEIDSKHFLLKATALFQSQGVCPDMMVYKDTVITFHPESAGEYFFQVNEQPFGIRSYTSIIN